MGRLIFNQPYDDPYRILACHLVSVLSVKSINTLLTSNPFIKSMVLNEAKQLDISGAFLDCIDQEIISNDKIRGKNVHLKSLGEYYYQNLDIPRLRREIRKFIDECGIIMEI